MIYHFPCVCMYVCLNVCVFGCVFVRVFCHCTVAIAAAITVCSFMRCHCYYGSTLPKCFVRVFTVRYYILRWFFFLTSLVRWRWCLCISILLFFFFRSHSLYFDVPFCGSFLVVVAVVFMMMMMIFFISFARSWWPRQAGVCYEFAQIDFSLVIFVSILFDLTVRILQ